MLRLLILAPDAGEDIEEGPASELFDQVLLDVIRALDLSDGRAVVLVPWTEDTAALVAAATMDSSPSFDPESVATEGPAVSSVRLYLPPKSGRRPDDEPFLRASHLPLRGAEPKPLAELVGELPPTHVLALAAPRWARQVLDGLELQPVVLALGALLDGRRVRDQLGAGIREVVDLTAVLKWRPPEAEDPEAAPDPEQAEGYELERGLEPFVPVGLMLQAFFSSTLDDGEPLKPEFPR